MDKKTLLHYLRNPYGFDEPTMRKARLQAADELERLYLIEDGLKIAVDVMESLSKKFSC